MENQKYCDSLQKVAEAVDSHFKREDVNLYQPSKVVKPTIVGQPDDSNSNIHFLEVSTHGGDEDEGYIEIIPNVIRVLPRINIGNCLDFDTGELIDNENSFVVKVDTSFKTNNITVSQERLISRLEHLKNNSGETTSFTDEFKEIANILLNEDIIEGKVFTFDQIDEAVAFIEEKAKKFATQVVKAKMMVRSKA